MEIIQAFGRQLYAGDKPVLLRGFGLGGWFLPEGYMWKLYTKCDRPRRMEAMIETLCGKEYASAFWDRYLDYYITEADVELIAKEGFNCVRLPLNARHLYEMHEHEPIWKDAMFARIDCLIAWCKKYQIYVILDLHGAPGGQTGQNIDDSEADQPMLFIEPHYEEELILLWKKIAERYCKEETVAGYDLMNEPLPNFFQQYNNQVLPLYRRLIEAIREIDQKHIIILEGVHWATDFSVFDSLTAKEAAENILLQFHKYWSNPDAESLQEYIRYSEDLKVPLFMGEGGENNCDWYTTVFPLYERLNISWSFWSFKKMDCTNSPITFDVPEGWEDLIQWIDTKKVLTSERAISIFDNFILSIQQSRVNKGVFKALKREVPVTIPGEAFEECIIRSAKIPGAMLRMSEPATILFENGKTGNVDYRRYGGEEQPEEENLLILLGTGDQVKYLFRTDEKEITIRLKAGGKGELMLTSGLEERIIGIDENNVYHARLKVPNQKLKELWVACTGGNVRLDHILLSCPESAKVS